MKRKQGIKQGTSHETGREGTTLGRERFAKISAVEGIVLSPAAKVRAEEADRLGLSGAERRQRIERAYRTR